MEKDIIRDLINKGFSNSQICNELKISKTYLNRKRNEYDLLNFKRPDFESKVSDKIKEEIISLFKSNKSCVEIAKIINKDRRTVSKLLKKCGFEIKKQIKNSNLNKICEICNKDTEKRRNICMTCYTNTRRYKLKKKMFDLKGGKCNKCSVSGLDISCYDFHHLDPTQKDFNLSGLNSARINWKTVEEELDKCILLCANCHREEHSNYKSEKFLLYIDKLKISQKDFL